MRAQFPGPTARLGPVEPTAQGKAARRLITPDQTERDHAALEEAVDSARTSAVPGV